MMDLKDDLLEILREINEQFPKMKIINKENGGLSVPVIVD